MPDRRSRGARAAVAAVLLLQAVTLLLLVPATAAAAEGECTLSVSPASARAGATFTFTGSGYTPTQLELSKDGGAATTVELAITDDPFTIRIDTRPGDEGTWTARAIVPETECAGEVTFTVSLPPTDAAAAMPGQDAPTAPILIAAMGLTALVAVGYSLRMVGRRGSGI
jgi:hypothetical protein